MMKIRSITNFLTLLLALMGCVVAIVLTYEDYHPKADIGCSKLGGDCSKTINSSYGHLGPIPTSIFGLGMYLTVAGLCFARHNAIKARRRAEIDHAYASLLPLEETEAEAPIGQEAAASLEDRPAEIEPRRIDTETRTLEEPEQEPLFPPRTPLKRLDTGIWAIALSAIAISWWLQYAALYEICSFCPWCFGSATLVTLMFLLASYDFLLAGRRLDGEQKLLAWVSGFIVICFGFVATPVVIGRIQACGPKKSDAMPPVNVVNKRDVILANYLKFKGDPKAKYALVEFGDYQCSHCKKAMGIVDGLLKSQPAGGVKFAFRNYHFPQHPWAVQASQAAEAAGEQGKFWEMHDLIFQNQKAMDDAAFSREDFDKWAESLKLDLKKFNTDFDSPAIASRISNDTVAADATDLKLTPSFYLITPTKVTLFSGFEDLEKAWHDPKSPYWQ